MARCCWAGISRISLAVVVAGSLAALPVAPGGAVGAQPQPAASQAPPSELLHLTVVKIRPDLLTEWQEFQRTETIPMLQKAGVKWRAAWTTGIFGEGFQYAFVMPVEKMAQYDQAQGPAVRALGEEAARAYNAKNRRFVESTHSYLLRTRPDLSYMPKPIEKPTIAVIANLNIVPGRGADMEAVLKSQIVPAMKQAGVLGYTVAQTVLGGDVNGLTTVTYINNFADLDQPWGLEKALGAAGLAKLAQRTSGIIGHHERFISRYVPNLSFPAPPG